MPEILELDLNPNILYSEFNRKVLKPLNIKSEEKKPKNTNKNFLIGADPEFCISRGGNLLNASNFIRENVFKGERYSSSQWEQLKFGADGGSGSQFELRPGPHYDPTNLVFDIQNILNTQINTYKSLQGCKFHAGSCFKSLPLGGHIHFGLKEIIKPKCDVFGNTSAYFKYVHALDQYLMPICILIERLGDSNQRRQHGGYGTLGDNRINDHGFEYRTPSSWITSPQVACAVLCLAKTIVYEVLNNKEHKLTDRFITNEDLFYYHYDRIKGFFPDIWARITKMKKYQTYKPYIDFLYFLVTNKLTWFPKRGMREAWGLINYEPLKNKVQFDIIWARYNQGLIK